VVTIEGVFRLFPNIGLAIQSLNSNCAPPLRKTLFMNISEVKEKLLSGEDLVAEVMRNPSDLTEWLIWIRESSGKSYMLAIDDGVLIKSTDTTSFFHLLKSLGFRQATVIF
jgi:hypothetical protein